MSATHSHSLETQTNYFLNHRVPNLRGGTVAKKNAQLAGEPHAAARIVIVDPRRTVTVNACEVEAGKDNVLHLAINSGTARGTHTMFSERKEELSINVPIQCGGVLVNPGDFIVADTIGVTVIPVARAEEVIDKAREQAQREQRTREWVAKGKTVEDLLSEFGPI